MGKPETCWWEHGVPVDAARLALVERTWRHFAEYREWAPHWDVRLEFERANPDRDFDALLNDWQVITAVGDPLRLVPTVPALLYLEPVRRLLAPLPKALSVSLERFRANPLDENSSARPKLAFSEVRHLWGADAELARALLISRDTPLRFSAWDENDATHYPNHESLLYANVQTLADVFLAKWGPPFAHLTSPLGEPHLALVRAIYEEVRANGDWPNGSLFAIEYNHRAYVPRLLRELNQAGFTSDFNSGSLGQLHLRWRVIPELGLTDAAFRLIRASIETYASQAQPGAMLIRAIAERAGLSSADATALYLLLANTWFQFGDRVADPNERTIRLREEIRPLRRITNWDEYVRIVHPDERPRAPAAVGVSLGPLIGSAVGDREWLGADGATATPLEALCCELNELEAMKDRQRAGQRFEGFLNRLFAHFALQPSGAFRVTGEQIDGSFVLDNEVYLLEAKWTRKKIGSAQVSAFSEKIAGKSPNTRGLFISLGGYTREGVKALTKGKVARFMMADAAHLRSVLSGERPLRELLQDMHRRWAERGEPYAPR